MAESMTRTALVTGASGGIGQATARDLGRDQRVGFGAQVDQTPAHP